MYLKITNKCNMTCEHCGMSSNSKGKHMAREVWKASIEFAKDREESITIGGGEPTLHPDFWEIIGLSIGNFEYVSMTTNGSITEKALALAKLAKKGVLGVDLSQDCFHDPIDEKVIEAFTKDKMNSGYGMQDNDSRGIRDTSANLIKAGRCKDGKEGCVCNDIMIMPCGTIRGCACAQSPKFGTVFSPSIPENWQGGECYKNQEDEDDHS